MRIDSEIAKAVIDECNCPGIAVRCNHCFQLINKVDHSCLLPLEGSYMVEMISLGKWGKMIKIEKESYVEGGERR
jgi:hypothetical protein